MEFKRQKQELNEYIEMEQLLYKEAEEEAKRKNAKNEIANFQHRVIDFSHKTLSFKKNYILY